MSGRRVGVPREGFLDRLLAPRVSPDLDRARQALTTLGVELIDVSIPLLTESLATELSILLTEAASYHEQLVRHRPEKIGAGVREAFQAGLLMPAAAYLHAQRTRTALQRAVRDVFTQHQLDALLTPTLPATSQRHDQTEFVVDGVKESVMDALVRTTAPFNLTGLPAIALPAGLDGDSLPTSVQLAGRPYADSDVIELARALEGALGWAPPAIQEPRGIAGAESEKTNSDIEAPVAP